MARASPALRSFVLAFGRCHDSSIPTAAIPVFLVPSLVPICTSFKPMKYQDNRRYASVTAPQHSTEKRVDGDIRSMRGLPFEVQALVLSPAGSKPAAWATLVDSYLPLNLRLGAEKVAERIADEIIQHEALQPIETLPDILSMASSYCKADLLSYIGVYQGRWKAIIWLVKAMMKKYPVQAEGERKSCQLPPPSWETIEQSLDVVTNNAIQSEMPLPSELERRHNPWFGSFSLDHYTWPYESVDWSSPQVLGRKALGQTWQSLGIMVVQAADHPAEDSSYSVIMSHVFQILGLLHRINAFPGSIYNYTPSADPTVLQRPPTLHLLSKRIMSTLSDVEWVLQWEETIAMALSQGYELPKASVQPKLREFGPELWLDLILWACVEGGWIGEGISIIIEMRKRRASEDTRWSTVSWQKICEVKAPKLDWASILRLEIDKTRLNQVGGIGIATGTNSHIEMGARTVSREVVLALTDGLLNDLHSYTKGIGMTVVDLHRSLIACKSLLDSNDSELDSNFMDAVILRISESFESVKEQPGSLDQFLDLKSTEIKQANRSSGTKSSALDQGANDPTAVLGLYHRSLGRFSVDGNLEGSLRTLFKIQRTVDAVRERNILAFADELRERIGKGDDVSDLIDDEEDRSALVQPLPIPMSALVPLVDLLTNSRLFELGNWLLLNEDIDGGLMDPALYSDQNLQPALLRFGTATSNSRLLIKILQRLETPLSEPVVHALLRFQVALGKWTAVEELLEYVKNAPDMAWRPSDATTIAKAILQMEHEPSDNVDPSCVPRAFALLQDLVNGKYSSKADPSQLIPDFSQTRTANQLGRIFRTLPGSLSKITTRPPGGDLRAHASAEIPPNAFNIILETIVDHHGSLAGKKLWEQWCRVPNVPKREQPSRPSFGDGEKVVTPKLYMLRSVLRPVLETRQALQAALKDEVSKMPKKAKDAASDDGQEGAPDSAAIKEKFQLGDKHQRIIDWGVDMYKRFGLSDNEISGVIPKPLFTRGRMAKKAVQSDEDGVDT